MTETNEERKIRLARDKDTLKRLLNDGNEVEVNVAEAVGAAWPTLAAGGVLAIVAAVAPMIDEAREGLSSMEAHGAHIEVERIQYPSGTVRLDAAGDLMGVDFSVPVIVE